MITTRSFRAGSSLSRTDVERPAEPPLLDTSSRQARRHLEENGGDADAVTTPRSFRAGSSLPRTEVEKAFAPDGEDAHAPGHAAPAQPSPGATRRGRGGARGRFVPPGWVPAEPWDAFVEMRRETGHKLTDRAKRLAIAELERLRDAGEDPGAVLDQSTLKAWRGLFAVTRPRWRTDARAHGESGRWAERGQEGRAEAAVRPASGPAPRAPLPVTADGRVTREGSIRALIERAALYRKIGRDDDARAAERDADRLRRAAAGSVPAGGGGSGDGGCGA